MRAPTFAFVSLCVLCGSTAAAAVRLCHDDEEGREGPSPHLVLMRELQRQSGMAIELHGRAWTRCLAELRAGYWDGIVGASYSTERGAMALYPMKGGQPDPAYAMNIDSYSLYRLRGGDAGWDGRHFSGMTGLVGAQRGYSVINTLRAAGLNVDASASSADDNLRKVLAGHVVAAVLLTSDAEFTLINNPDFRKRIARIGPPVVSKPFYLAFSLRFGQANPALVQKIWQAIPAARDAETVRNAQSGLRHH